MNTFGILSVVGLCLLYRSIHLIAGHHHELETIDALDRIFRWCIVVAAVWFIVATSMYVLGHVDVSAAFALTEPRRKP